MTKFSSLLGMKTILCAFLFLADMHAAFSGGIRGHIKGDDGSPLAFATIYVRQTGSGAISDPDGKYEITLSSGHYDLVYHYLGFETQTLSVEIPESSFLVVDIKLKPRLFNCNL